MFHLACELVRNERIGKLKNGKGLCPGRIARRAVPSHSGARGIELGLLARPGAQGGL